MATLTWTGAESDDWNAASNWSETQVPGSEDTALIDLTGVGTPEIASSVTVADVILNGGSLQLDLAGDLEIRGGLSVISGTVLNSGLLNLADLENAGSIENTGLLVVTGNTLTNPGTIDNRGEIQLFGTVSSAGLADIGRFDIGTIQVFGTLDNEGLLLRTPYQTEFYGVIVGGTIDAFSYMQGHPILDDVTILGSVFVSEGLIIRNRLSSTDASSVS